MVIISTGHNGLVTVSVISADSSDPDEIAYGPSFARLAEEEVRMRQEEEAYLRSRKKNKGSGDCKQQ